MHKSRILSEGARVRVVFDRAQRGDLPQRLAAFLSGSRGPLEFSVEATRIPIAARTMDRQTVFDSIDAHRSGQEWSADDVVCILTPKPDSLNWYSACATDGRRLFYIHSEGWDWLGTVRPDAAIAYDIVQNVLTLALAEVGVAYQACIHEPSIGCIFDFCQQKAEWTLKLRTADICEQCLQRFESHGASDELLRQIVALLELARTTALSTSRYRVGEAPFARWPYPVAITRHKAAHETEPGRQVFALIDHFDSLLRYTVYAEHTRRGGSLALEERPSLGNWVQHFGRVVEEPVRGQVLAIINEHGLVHYRNETRGHGWQRTEKEFAKALPALRQAITELEASLEPLLRRPAPVIIEGAAMTPAGGYSLTGKRLAGSNSLFEPYKQDVGRDPRALGVVLNTILLEIGNEYRSMQPWIEWRECSECQHQRVLLSDGASYIDAQVGHRVRG